MEFELRRAIEILERTPRVFSELLSGLSQNWVIGDEGEGTFSPRDVIGHCLHGEVADWITRAEIIMNDGVGRTFHAFDRFIFLERYRGRDVEWLLQEFADARAASLIQLRELELDEEALDREGEHPELGRVTLRQLLATWVVHDLAHLEQAARVMARQYQCEIGPWWKYFSLFNK